ncbi:MAG: phage/plasmid primase, P4 family [Candidatus Krumholzibacteria bacterium]|nr:phage/plasmid primase, P4 family [Candidatus Krumholzibacteria bacterium]MDH4336263.1 phage/plasmid primase, P4 family [Candidatus Krumholzibacteria bacterium]MDH5269698.1 phage/plasmid primase, P4 family [Candidatus Krumholzibacteria bacterium]
MNKTTTNESSSAQRTIDSCYEFVEKHPELARHEEREQVLAEQGIDVPPSHFNCTDMGNAERLAATHGATLRYCQAWGSWMCWDGKRWFRDRTGVAARKAKATVRAIYNEASQLNDGAIRRGLAKHALRSEAQGRIVALLELAKTDARIAILPEEFDGPDTRYLLNVLNGTIDLRTGECRRHSPRDFITKLAPVTFDPAAESHRWEEFLARIVPDAEVRRFLQRYVGSALSGDTGDQCFALLHGTGANGKTTFVEALLGLLGDYGHQPSFESFLEATGRSDRRGGPRADLLALRGVRFVAAVEAGPGRWLDETVIKQLTGGDTITVRGLYEAMQTSFTTEAKICLVANHRPEIRGGDEAIWRRVLEVPFLVTIPNAERDPRLKARLCEPAELSGILNWGIAGCREWIAADTNRLRPPAAVMAATRRYQSDQDRFRPFLDEHCVLQADGWVSSRELRAVYETWCRQSDENPMSAREMAERLQSVGATKDRRGRGAAMARGWRGIALASHGVKGNGDSRDAGDAILSQPSLGSPPRGRLSEMGVSGVNASPPGTEPH